MPITSTAAQNDHRFEVLQKFADDPHKPSAKSAARRPQRVLHPVAIHFKGSGFYSTDYGRRKKAGSESKSEGSSDGKSSEKSEKKSSEGGSSEPKKAAEA